jgi:hypothetical protein
MCHPYLSFFLLGQGMKLSDPETTSSPETTMTLPSATPSAAAGGGAGAVSAAAAGCSDGEGAVPELALGRFTFSSWTWFLDELESGNGLGPFLTASYGYKSRILSCISFVPCAQLDDMTTALLKT